jgi:hypothetical protein
MYIAGSWITGIAEEMYVTDATATVKVSTVAATDPAAWALITYDTAAITK